MELAEPKIQSISGTLTLMWQFFDKQEDPKTYGLYNKLKMRYLYKMLLQKKDPLIKQSI